MKNDKLKEKKANKAAKGKGAESSGHMLLGIRNKIVICFLVPIIFMVIIGVSAYQKAQEGMSEKFQESTQQTIVMAKDYIEMSCSFIEAEGLKYAFDANVSKYLMGSFDNAVEKMGIVNGINTNMLSSQLAISFIDNIHIVTKENTEMITTAVRKKVSGILTEYKESVAADYGIENWIDSHPLLDEALEVNDADYVMAYELLSKHKNGCVVIDIKQSAVTELIGGLDLGEGSIVGFITKNGKEVIVEQLKEGQESKLTDGEKVFFGQDFFGMINEENLQGSAQIVFHGNDYLFFYSRSEKNDNITVCALVPMSVVTSQAQEIKMLTIALVILACIIALVVGFSVAAGIQANMKGISGKFEEVAKGDLTVTVKAKGQDEFQGLAGSATHMITNTKNLVNKVANATDELEKSARGVEDVSSVINECSLDITNAIDEIHEGIGRQSENAAECVTRTDVLSNEIEEVAKVVEKVEKLVDENESMISQGIEIVRLLGERATQTTQMTKMVGSSIESLKKESEIISTFIETITSISEQTNLLSLNASIEAARAGEAGRGFAVVAEEIRKLADDSAKAAGEIQNNVSNIVAQTDNSVKSADQAQSMVALQTESVEQVVKVFGDMRKQMNSLAEGLDEIVTSIEKADIERRDTVQAVQNISDIIEKTAEQAEKVKDIAGKLITNVENLNETADVLGDNMQGLKSEISLFKI